MDTKKDCRIPECGKLPDIGNTKVVVGAKQLKKALRDGRAQQVYLAQNADPQITGPIEKLCLEHQVSVTWVQTMTQLGKACGIEVGAAAAAQVH